jgi:UDP-N-acetylmuramoyl-L-alanyl-D-glutamate--2,6-diaminopimelate ligase
MPPFSRGEAGDVDLRPAGTDFSWRGRRVHLALPGEHNVVNALGAATAAMLLGVEPDEVVEGLGKAARVPGRFEPVDTGASFHAFVDYAHTPDALEVALRNAATLAAGGRVIVVFGCGGERDRLKRPMMGAIAARHADVAVLTGDNPRREDPASIMRDVLSGVPQGSQVVTEPDRRSAIELAVSMALPGDVVVVAGKGHETTIDLGGEKLPFDDRVELAQAIAKRIGEVRGSGEGIA